MLPPILKEEQILSEAFRLQVIKAIKSPANQSRKKNGEKRQAIFKNKTPEYVRLKLEEQGFKKSTIKQMMARCSNIGILKKIVKKKARAYVSGVDRTLPGTDGAQAKAATESIQGLSDYLGATQVFQKGDEFRELFLNALIYLYPIAVGEKMEADGLKKIWGMTTRVLGAHEFDAIPDAQNPERAAAIVLSDYQTGLEYLNQDSGVDGYRPNASMDGTAGTNAVTENAASKERYVWWSGKYHLTCDGNGRLVVEPGMARGDQANLIKQLPFVGLYKDQDGHFWACGGDDVMDADVLINLLITDAAGILSAQGWGQPVLIRKKKADSTQEVEIGPHNVIDMEMGDDGAQPSFSFESTDPHTDAWLKLVEMYLALVLTTNNLSPRNISGKLDASTVASGIAKMIDESESTEDISLAQAYYQKREREFWVIAQKWLEVLKPTGRLAPELEKVQPFNGAEVNTKFRQIGVVLSETERADLVKLKKENGVTRFTKLIQMENPGMSDEDAEKELQAIIKQRLEILAADPTLLAAESSAATVSTDQQLPGSGGEDPGQPAAQQPPKTGVKKKPKEKA